jgi:uncharacterized damage-inducible protein DinB
MELHPEPTLLELIRYNNWANRQVIDACQKLSHDQLATSLPGAYGSVRDTLEHIIRAETGYIGRLTGNRPQPPFEWNAGAGVADLSAFAEHVAEALLDAVQHIPPTHVVHQEWDGKPVHYQARAVLIQIINHGIEHRTNITTFLNQAHLSPPEVDGWGYLSAHPDRFEMG